jgi:serine/threonine protein phosphatase PrpC
MLNATKHIEAGGKELQDRATFFWQGPILFLTLADGAGGMSGGAEAAEFVIQRVQAASAGVALKSDALSRLLSAIDREMAGIGAYGETTCVLAAVSETGIVGASVGDSGAWIITESGVDNVTAHQWRKPFVGSGRANPVGFHRGPLQGTLLVASDGLLKYASAEQIAKAALAADLNQASCDLVSLVRYPSGALPDDLSILLARNA